ncbi:MAG: hypothetical protein LBL66_07655, partial [Clostridiales bacterium]|nr:hypothetical protein [Clostridiales bacterium]
MVTTTRTKVSKERYDASAMRSGILRAERETPEYAEARIAYPDDERYEEFKRELPEPDYTGAQEHRTRYESDYAEPAARHYREEDFMPTIRTMRQLNRAPERVVEKERVQERAKRADPA